MVWSCGNVIDHHVVSHVLALTSGRGHWFNPSIAHQSSQVVPQPGTNGQWLAHPDALSARRHGPVDAGTDAGDLPGPGQDPR
jgi:hypothetical protein